jgi:predicted ArsR family transcriptional regulator
VTKAALSKAAERFLTEDVVSVARLDLLLFLHRHSELWWTADKLAAELEMPADAVQSHLEHLSARNLLDVRIAESVVFCYKPGREKLAQLVEDVAQAHYRYRDVVVAVLAGRPADGARLFAEAFLFRRDKKQDG